MHFSRLNVFLTVSSIMTFYSSCPNYYFLNEKMKRNLQNEVSNLVKNIYYFKKNAKHEFKVQYMTSIMRCGGLKLMQESNDKGRFH
jgi:hypothetical protein